MRIPLNALTLACLVPFAFGIACVGGSVADRDEAQVESLDRPHFTSLDVPDDSSFHLRDQIVVDFADGTTKAEFDELEREWGIDLELADQEEGVDSAITVGAVSAEAEVAALLARIAAHPKVEVAEPTMTYRASFKPNDPDYGRQWNLELMNMPKAWDVARGKGVVVAVLDTGIAYEDYEDFRQVPDLRGARFVDGYDFVNQDRHANDDRGHGTHVAGTIAQVTDNGEGVAGVAFEAHLMPVKVLDHLGVGTSPVIADAIRWAADHGAKVINMSFGGAGRSAVLENAITYARKYGAVVVCAAGNSGRGVVEFPGAYPGSVAVGAVGPKGSRAPYSSWGKELDISAPGGDKTLGEEAGVLQNTIDPLDPSKSVYVFNQGTSMAAPHVAGLAAMLFSAGAKNPDQVEKAIFASATLPAGATGWTEQYGHGTINAAKALKALKALKTLEALPSELSSDQNASADVDSAGEPNRASTFSPLEWKPLAWAGGLLAFVLLTLSRRERPGFLNVLVRPSFLAAVLLCTVGVFFVRWFMAPSELSAAVVLPIPDWLNRIIFGRGSLANPLVYSALLPVALSVVAIKARSLRSMAGGLALGFAAILAYSAWAHAPALAWLPFTYLAIPWLVVNSIVCLFLARAMLRKETATP